MSTNSQGKTESFLDDQDIETGVSEKETSDSK